MFRTRHQVACEMFICRKRSEHLVEKILSLVLFDSNCSFKTVKCSFFNQVIVYQSFYGVPLTFNYVLLQGKFLYFGTHREVATLGSRGYFFLIDTSRRSRVSEVRSAEEKKITSGHRSTQPHFHARNQFRN